MPRRRWKLKSRREPLSAAMTLYLERGLGVILAMLRDARPAGWEEAVFFGGERNRADAWQEYGEEITSAWAAEHAGVKPWGWWRFVATEPRACLEGGEFVWKPGAGDWVWRKGFGLPGRPQVRRPGAAPARLLFESQAVYLRRLNLLGPGEAERLTADDVEPEIVEIPELPEQLSVRRASSRTVVNRTHASDLTNGAPRRPAA